MKTKLFVFFFTLVALLAGTHPATAQGTAFTYQGRLNGPGGPANGSYDFTFAIYDLPTGNGGFAIQTNLATPVSNGLFAVTLDFGSGSALIFSGPERWLEIAVRTNAVGGFTNLSPRQKITATPYAITAGNLSGSISASQLSGTLALGQLPPAVVTNNQSGVSFSGSFSGNAGGLTNVPVNALVRTTNSPVVAWGDNSGGQTNVPAGLSNVAAVAAAWSHSLALKSNGTVVAWGDNTYSQTNVPAGLTNVVAVAAGAYHNVALKTDGTVIAWGRNNVGQTNVPAGLTDVTAVAAGGYHNLALKTDGTVVTWGNFIGELSVPAGLNNVAAVAAGGYHSLALKADGTVVAWGDNGSGQTNVPAGLTGVTAVAAGSWHSLALKANGTVVAWGNNGFGATNVPAGLANVVAVAAGDYHSLALKANGTVAAWGGNFFGETDVPPELTGVVALAPGSVAKHVLVIRKPADSPVAWLSANNTFSGQNNFNNAVGTFSGTFAGNGGGLINVNALTLGGLSSSNLWKTGGNAGTTPGLNFLGTTDNQPLELRVDGARALRIEPHGASAPSLVGGFFQNSVASYNGAVVAGGGTNGSPNYALGDYAFVGAGHGGRAAAYSAVVAGAYNDSPGSFSFIGSGEANTNSVIYSFIGGGKNNSIQANATHSVLGGGNGNSIQASAGSSVLGGGANNSIQTNAFLSFIGGGANNFILPNASVSFLGGGSDNSIRPLASYSVLGGGQNNSIQTNGYYSVLGGGYQNSILPNGQWATIPGGRDNTATNYAFAAGRRAKANQQGSFVWADSNDFDFSSTAVNKVRFRCTSGFDIVTGIDGSGNQNAGVFLGPGGTSWQTISDRNAKKNFQPVDTVAVLNKLAGIPVTQWNYRWEEDSAVPHLGPMAQDFKAAFFPGGDEKTISTLEFDGVALAAIQGLNEKVEEQRAELKQKQTEITELKQKNDSLENRLDTLEKIIRSQKSN